MIPVKLTISRFLSYRKTPVEIDFSHLHIACISGANGAGKSAMLDAMTWALFGEARKSDDSVINNAKETDDANQPIEAKVTFEFFYENDRYKVIRTKRLGRSTALDLLLWDAQNEEWKAQTEKTVTKTNQLISSLLRMDYSTFINASFFLQGKADQFTNQNPTNRKQILSNILGLDIWEQYKSIAAEKRREAMGALSLIQKSLEEIDRELMEEPQRIERFQVLADELIQAEARQAVAQSNWEMAKSIEAQAKTQTAFVMEKRNRIARLETELIAETRILEDRTRELVVCQQKLAHEQETQLGYQSLQSVRQFLAQFTQKATEANRLSLVISQARNQIAIEANQLEIEHDALMKEAKRVSDTQGRIAELQLQESAIQNQLVLIDMELQGRDEAQLALRAIETSENVKKAENLHLKKEMDEIKNHLTAVEQAETDAPCPFCGRVLDSEHQAKYRDALAAEGGTLGDRFRANKAELDSLHAEWQVWEERFNMLAKLERAKNELIRNRAPLVAERSQLEKLQTDWAEKSTRFNDVTAMLAQADFAREARGDLQTAEIALQKIGYDEGAHRETIEQELNLRHYETDIHEIERTKSNQGQLERDLKDRSVRITKIENEKSEIIQELQLAEETLAHITKNQPNLEGATALFDVAQSETNRLNSEKGKAEQLVAVLTELKKRKENELRQRDDFARQVSEYRMLEDAFSKNGIPALLIDQALPEIEEHANRILGKLTDERMSLQFSTQQEYKDRTRDEKKETLAILISDETGQRDYELYSGGEAFRVNFAIRLALSHLLTRRAGARLQMLVIDEGFGSQDADGRQRLIEAITAVQYDYEKILVITHLEELKDAFPSRIEVEKTTEGSKVTVIS